MSNVDSRLQSKYRFLQSLAVETTIQNHTAVQLKMLIVATTHFNLMSIDI